MTELDAELGGAVLAAEAEHPVKGRLVLLVVEAEVAMRDAADLLDRRRLQHQKARARHGERTEMHEVPVVRVAVDRAVLAHRRDHDAVFEILLAESDRREKLAHGYDLLARVDERYATGIA